MRIPKPTIPLPKLPTISITGFYFNMLKLPTVYAWVRGSQYLYVGCSTKVFHRLLTHQKFDKIEKFLPTDRLLFWMFESGKQALRFEYFLINHHKPRHNGRIKNSPWK